MVIADIKGTIEYVNSTFVERTGYAKEDIIGKNLSIFQSDQHPLAFPPEIWNTIIQGQEWQGEIYPVQENGMFYQQLNSVVPIKDISGTIQRFLFIMEDITDRKRAENALKERLHFEELLSTLSARFVNLPAHQVDAEIEKALQQLLEFFPVDRCGLLRIIPDKNIWQVTHAASVAEVPPVPVGTKLPRSIYPWVYDTLVRHHQVVYLPKIEDLPAEATIDRQTYTEWGIQSSLLIPLVVDDPVIHVIASRYNERERIWPQELVPRLQLLGEIFINALKEQGGSRPAYQRGRPIQASLRS